MCGSGVLLAGLGVNDTHFKFCCRVFCDVIFSFDNFRIFQGSKILHFKRIKSGIFDSVKFCILQLLVFNKQYLLKILI